MSEQDLFIGVESDNLDEIKRLVASGLSTRCVDKEKEQDLFKACRSGSLDEVQRLVSFGVSLKCRDRGGGTLMHSAVTGSHKETTEWLFHSGISVTDKDEYGRSPLHFAYGNEMRDFLRVVDPAAYSVWEEEQDLLNACKRGDLNEAKRLVDSGVSLKCRDKWGSTPCHHVITRGHKEVAKWLFSLGASCNDKDQLGMTPLMLAAYNTNNEELVQMLIANGGAQDEQEVESAVTCALQENRRETVCLLMKQLKWFSRRGFLMFLATQSYLLPPPPLLEDYMSRDELNAYYQQFYNPETRPNKAVHSVFFMQDLQRYIMSFIGPKLHIDYM